MRTLLILLASTLAAAAAETNCVHHCCCVADKEAVQPALRLSDKSIYQLDSFWTNDAGAAVKLDSLRGRPQIVAMFFANCTYACPLLVYQMQQMESALPAALRDKVGFTLISFDSERDTPAALCQYRQAHGLDKGRWTLLRGSPDQVLELGALLNVKFKKDAQGQYLHSNIITLLNSDGEIALQNVGLTTDHTQMIRQASELAQASRNAAGYAAAR